MSIDHHMTSHKMTAPKGEKIVKLASCVRWRPCACETAYGLSKNGVLYKLNKDGTMTPHVMNLTHQVTGLFSTQWGAFVNTEDNTPLAADTGSTVKKHKAKEAKDALSLINCNKSEKVHIVDLDFEDYESVILFSDDSIVFIGGTDDAIPNDSPLAETGVTKKIGNATWLISSEYVSNNGTRKPKTVSMPGQVIFVTFENSGEVLVLTPTDKDVTITLDSPITHSTYDPDGIFNTQSGATYKIAPFVDEKFAPKLSRIDFFENRQVWEASSIVTHAISPGGKVKLYPGYNWASLRLSETLGSKLESIELFLPASVIQTTSVDIGSNTVETFFLLETGDVFFLNLKLIKDQ